MTNQTNEDLLNSYIKQKEELEKLIEELQSQMNNTNIPFAKEFLERYKIYNASSVLQKENLLELKLFVNKKCNQISNDAQHTAKLIEELKRYENDTVFFDLFLLKLLDQGKVQVASQLEFYKPLGYILANLKDEFNKHYIRLTMYKNVNEMEIKGIYAIYFGCLYYKNDYESAWFILASILNVEPSQLTAGVLEAYFLVLTELLWKISKKRLIKIYKYLERFYFKKMNNVPVEIRIKQKIEEYINK